VDRVTVQLEISRRERKKQATRQALHEAAFVMVEEHGLAAVTVEAIADRADVATRTFFNYFSSKEDSVLDRDPGRPEALRFALLARPAGEDALTALRRVMEDLVAQEILDGEHLLRRMRLIRSEPLLRGAMAAMHDEIEEALVVAVAQRTGRDPVDDVYPALVVSAALAAFKVALLRWSDQGGREPFDRVLTAAFKVLAEGLADAGARRS
jgi:AcrR family transcriptional regulator